MSLFRPLRKDKEFYIEKYYPPFEKLIGQFATDVYDVSILGDDTYCVIEFSNKEVYWVQIPNVKLRDKQDLLTFSVREGMRIVLNDTSNEIMVHLGVGCYGVWFPTGEYQTE